MTMNKLRSSLVTALGIGGAVAVGCGACCMPLVTPFVLSLLAGAGIYRFGGASGMWSGVIAGVAALFFLAVWKARQRRRRPNSAARAPVACTLSATDFKGRAVWLRELTERSLVSHRVDGERLFLSYQLDAREDVEKMVRQERECCGFLTYELTRGAESLDVIVTAPAGTSADAHALFAHLIPAASSAERAR
jgi:hypothetical protein